MKYEMKSHEMQYKMKRTRKIYISVDLVVFFWGGNKTHTEETLSVEPFQANCNLRDCHGMTPLMEAAAANYAEAWDVGPLGNPGVAGVQNTNGPRLWRRCWVKNLPSLVRRPWVGWESELVPWVYLFFLNVSFTSKTLLYRWLRNVTKCFSCVSLFLTPSRLELHMSYYELVKCTW